MPEYALNTYIVQAYKTVKSHIQRYSGLYVTNVIYPIQKSIQDYSETPILFRHTIQEWCCQDMKKSLTYKLSYTFCTITRIK
ncbi:MAG: hypothetical protein ACW9W4_08645 [Candidatus Nitrosopumilus sp. bin_7KS]